MNNKLLIVDDENAILRSLTRLFRHADYAVFTANSAQAALAVMQQESCKVVITDLRMPVMDGTALVAELKIHFPFCLCIVLSGFEDFKSVLTLLNSGSAFRFLQKPWNEKALLDQVTSAFATYHERRYKTLVNELMTSSTDGLIELVDKGQIRRVNGLAKKIFNVNDIQGMTLATLLPSAAKQDITHLLENHNGQGIFKTTSGSNIVVRVKMVDRLSRVLQVLSPEEPISTNLNTANLAFVMDQKAILRSLDALLGSAKPFAVVALRLKNYEYWSEIIGFAAAEELASDILLKLLEQANALSLQLGHLADEQFILILDNFSSEPNLHQQLMAFIEPFKLATYLTSGVRVEFVITYCIAPDDGNGSRQLLNNAVISNRLHLESNSSFVRYDISMHEHKREQLLIREALFHAIKNKQLYLHYQPKYDLLQRKVTSCEALLRWDHPTLGPISPAVFIPIAEQEGQIIELGYWVLQRACQSFIRWIRKGVKLDKIAINISGKQLADDDFIERVEAIMASFDIDTSRLEFELTESWLVENMEQSIEKLNRLKASGITIAIDDFGTGYSSLSYLSKLPIDVIKIDRSLIVDIVQNLNTQSMVANVTRMAHEMNLQVVVEGVETLEQLLILEQLKCDVIQGFFIARPQCEDKLIKNLLSIMTEVNPLLEDS
jgi:EAL domain-containing protein (putative c-di-GMP-specific phosphodiesterase class I)/FixJ family two-component response regulator